MEKKTKLYEGGRKNVRGAKQIEAASGRNENRKYKQAFREGGTAKATRYPTGPVPPHQVNVPPAKKGKA